MTADTTQNHRKGPIARFFSKFYNKDDAPPEIYNVTLYLTMALFGILGSARGYDEGNIAGTMAQKSFITLFKLNEKGKSKSYLANLNSNIKSMVLLGSIGGCLIAIYLNDKIGRVRTLQVLCIGWIVGTAIQITATSVGQLYAGRLIEGLAIGQTVVVGPCYLAEVSPKGVRGLSNGLFAGAVYLGSSIANFANYGTAVHIPNTSRKQWVIPTALKIVLAGILFVGSLFVKESPRWLVKVNKIDRAYESLSCIRNLPSDHPYILSEISDIQEGLAEENSATKGVSNWQKVKELVTKPSLRYRLLLGLAAQLLGQWTFAGSITMYLPELASLVGIEGSQQIMFSGVLGIVKMTSSYLAAFFLIDFFGRRSCLYIGLVIQLVSTLYYATFLAIVPDSTKSDYVMSGSEKHAAVSSLAALFITGTGWAVGWNSIQYLINSEMFPMRVRSWGTAIIMAFHYACQYSNSKALPSLLIALKPYGTFYFASGVIVLSLFYCWFFLPEVAGRSLESMEELFSLPWYLIGRRGAELAPDHSGVTNIHVDKETGAIEIKQEEQYIERVSVDSEAYDETLKKHQDKDEIHQVPV